MFNLTQNCIKYLIIFCIYYLEIVKSDCILKYPDNIETVPRYEKHVGVYKLQIPYTGNHIQLQDGEIINGICDTYFSEFFYNVQTNNRWNPNEQQSSNNPISITLTCNGNDLKYNGHTIVPTTFKCLKLKWNLYNTNDTYSWCEKNQNSSTFLFVTKSHENHHILAGICYNMKELALQTVNYNITYSQRNDVEMLMGITKTNLKSYQSLGDDLWNVKNTKSMEISKEILHQQLTHLSKTKYWLHLANYEVASIIQGDSYANYFKEYENILNIIWWRNLRIGNWKRFMNTLEHYAYNNSFELYTGTSDVVRYPMERSCEQNNILEIKIGFKNETIPAYIWTYLKSNDNLNQDFVIVAYNSPYTEFFSLKDIIFCPDICSEIPWLTNIESSFHFATAGIMFCCSADFIRQTNNLHGFPMDVLISRLRENTPVVEEKTENILNVTNIELDFEMNSTDSNDIEKFSITLEGPANLV